MNEKLKTRYYDPVTRSWREQIMEEENSIAESLESITRALRLLGNADANTPMGAIEALGAVIKEVFENGFSEISDSLESIAESIRTINENKPKDI